MRHPISPGTRIEGTRLTVDSVPEYVIMPNGHKRICYLFKCDCGERKLIKWKNVLHPTVSCGCRSRETSAERSKAIRASDRICRICGAKESKEEFPNRNMGNICRPCLRKLDKERYSLDKVSDRIERDHINFLKHLLLGAKRRKKYCDITLLDLLSIYERQCGKCAVTGLKLAIKLKTPYTISIDRMNSSFGYTKDNIQLVCYSINLAKSAFRQDVFDDFLRDLRS